MGEELDRGKALHWALRITLHTLGRVTPQVPAAGDLARWLQSLGDRELSEEHLDEFVKRARTLWDPHRLPAADDPWSIACLALTALHCDMGTWILQAGRLPAWLDLLRAHPVPVTECNRVFLHDLMYSAYLWRAREIVPKQGPTPLVDELASWPQLWEVGAGDTLTVELLKRAYDLHPNLYTLLAERFRHRRIVSNYLGTPR